MTILPTVHLWNNDPDRSHFAQGWTVYHAMLRRRLGDNGAERLFGPDKERANACIDRLI